MKHFISFLLRHPRFRRTGFVVAPIVMMAILVALLLTFGRSVMTDDADAENQLQLSIEENDSASVIPLDASTSSSTDNNDLTSEVFAFEKGSFRISGQTSNDEGLPSFDPNNIAEQVRNRIQTPANGRPFISRPNHQATFGDGWLSFTPLGSSDPSALLTVELAAITVGPQPLFTGPAATPVEIADNIAVYQRGPALVEEFVAQDGGIEQRWQIERQPVVAGDLVITVEIETTLAMALAEGGKGVIFRLVDTQTGQMIPVAGYGQALAIDAAGRSRYAELSTSELASNRYRIEMTLPAEWLAQASYPLLVDPLIGSLVRVDNTGEEADQARPVVAYRTSYDQFLVVWQDGRNGDDDIFAQRVSASGTLVGDNITVYAGGGGQTVPDVAYNADDDTYLAVWRSLTDTIQAQVISGTGSLAGSVLTLSGASGAAREVPAVAYSPGAAGAGVWLVTWQEWNSGNSSYDVVARAVQGNGSLEAAYTVFGNGDDSVLPDVAANDSGGFLVAWEQEVGSGRDIYAYRTAVTMTTGSLLTVTAASNNQVAPAVTYNADDDRYLVAWQDQAGTDSIWARQVTGVTGGGDFAGSAFQVSDGSSGDKTGPTVTYFTPGSMLSGTYLVAWERFSNGDLNLEARRVLTTGATSGAVIALMPRPDDQTDVALGFGPVITATLAAWTDEAGGATDVMARLVEADADLGDPFLLHPTPDDQNQPQVAYNPDDDEYLVVWHDYRAGEANPDIHGQLVSGAGVLVGDNITITAASYRQLYPQVAYGSGRYLVIWQHYLSTSDTDYDAYGQIISRTGTLVGSALGLATGTTQDKPTDVVYNSTAAEFLAVYQRKSGGAKFKVWGRPVSPAGTLGTAVQISFDTTKDETAAVIAYNPDDNQYLVVWESGGVNLFGRRMTGAGVVTSTEIITIANGTAAEKAADVAYLAETNRYAVIWQDNRAGAGNYNIFGRLVTPAGVIDGGDYTIANHTSSEDVPRLDLDGDGGAVVIWYRSGDLYGRRLSNAGQPTGSAFTILTADYQQTMSALAGNGAGQYLLTWQDERNGNWDIYGQLYQHLTAGFTASPTSGSTPLTVVFTDTSVPTGVADLWHWQFGGGGVSASQHPTHTYSATGLFTVTLTITDTATGETDTEVKVAYINVAPGWSQMTATNEPNVIGEYAMVYDISRAVIVLYSGNATGWPYEDSTWEFDGSDWTLITTTQQPPAVYGAAMAYDSAHGEVVLFGGSSSADVALNQTWTYDGSDWTQTAITGTTPPSRTNPTLIYNPDTQSIYLFGGHDEGTYYNDLWVFDGTGWSQVNVTGTLPAARTLHAMAYNPDDEKLYLFGGRTVSGTLLADLWAFDVATNAWNELTPAGPNPAVRQAHSLIYQPEWGSLVLVGGVSDDGDTRLDDTWHYQDDAWVEAEPIPIENGVAYHVLVLDVTDDSIYLFTSGETWQYR